MQEEAAEGRGSEPWGGLREQVEGVRVQAWPAGGVSFSAGGWVPIMSGKMMEAERTMALPVVRQQCVSARPESQ